MSIEPKTKLVTDAKGNVASPEHHLAITTNTIVERLSGHTEDFDVLEKTSHLKQGVEIPMMVLGSMPDFLRTYDAWRDIQAQKKNEKNLTEAILMLDGEELSEEERQSGIQTFVNEHDARMGSGKKMLLNSAINMIEGPNKHYLQLSVGIEGKRAEQLIKQGTAIQTHQAVKEEGKLGKIWGKITGKDED